MEAERQNNEKKLKLCKFKKRCKRDDCWFLHPERGDVIPKSVKLGSEKKKKKRKRGKRAGASTKRQKMLCEVGTVAGNSITNLVNNGASDKAVEFVMKLKKRCG